MSMEQLISEVNGSMAIEGMPLTDDDKSRIRRCLENPDEAANILHGLIAKHQKKAHWCCGKCITDMGMITNGIKNIVIRIRMFSKTN